MVSLLPEYGAAQACNGWVIEVAKAITPAIAAQLGDQSSGACRDAGPCGDLYYYVSLVKSGGSSSPNGDPFHASLLSFSGVLSVIPDNTAIPPTGTQQPLSRLDPAASLACSPVSSSSTSGVANALVKLEENGTFSFFFGAPNGDDMNWTIYGGRQLLMVIAVRAYPGELAGLTTLKGEYQAVIPPNSYTSCTAIITGDTDLYKTVAAPSACSPSLKLRVGSAQNEPTAEFPYQKKVPVYLSGTAFPYTIDELDFLVKVTSDQPMAAIFPKGVTLPDMALSSYLEYAFSTSDVRIHVSTKQSVVISSSSASNPLFYVFINGPALSSACATTKVELFGPGKIKLPGTSCCKPDLGDTQGNGMMQQFSIGPSPCIDYCNSKVALKIKRVEPFPATANKCADMFFALEITNTGASNVTFNGGTITIDANYGTGALSFNTYLQDPSTIVSNSTNPVATTTTNVPAGTLRMIFNFMPLNPVVLTQTHPTQPLGIFQLQATNVCVERISFHDAVMTAVTGNGGTGDCVIQVTDTEIGKLPKVIGMETPENEGLCSEEVIVKLKTQYNSQDGIADATVTVSGKCSATSEKTNSTGAVSICDCRQPGTNILTPSLDQNPLNGVSTYDLVLISRHILGLEPSGNPYKMVAADANQSGSITSFDIVELRKLILGIYQTLPNNTSWRFIPKSFAFPNPNNPFQAPFPESDSYTQPTPPGLIEFYGVKIGDVNGNALPNLTGPGAVDRESATLPLGFHLPPVRRGELTEIPVFLRQSMDLAGWQCALCCDTTQVSIRGVRWADLAEPTDYVMADWSVPAPGEIRLSWFDRRGIAIRMPAQTPIAYVQVEWKGSRHQAIKPILELLPTIPGEAYGDDGQGIAFTLEAVDQYQAPALPARPGKQRPEWTVLAYPNPTNGLFRFEIGLPIGGQGRIGFYDPMGRLVAGQDCVFTSGENVVTSQQFPPLSAGIYFVRFDTPSGRKTLRLVKN